MLKMFMKNKKGFTLVELMVVVVILGILVAIAVPVYNATTSNAETRACQANIRTLNGTCSQYRIDKNAYPSALTDLVSNGYLTSVPTCPTAGATYTYSSSTGRTVCSVATHALP